MVHVLGLSSAPHDQMINIHRRCGESPIIRDWSDRPWKQWRPSSDIEGNATTTPDGNNNWGRVRESGE